MTGELRENRGRIVIYFPKKIEIFNKGWGHVLSRDESLVAIKTAVLLKEQPDQCLECSWGVLIDVFDRRDRIEKKYRNLYCLKGIADPFGCYINAIKKIRKYGRK